MGRGRASLQLIERLGLQSQTLVSSPSARSRYIMQDGRLERLPTSVWGVVTSPLTRSLPWAALADLRVPRRQGDEVRCRRDFGLWYYASAHLDTTRARTHRCDAPALIYPRLMTRARTPS